MVVPNNHPRPGETEPDNSPTISNSKSFIPWWRFALPLLLQTALIAAVPAQSAYTYFTGKTVILETRPVDPYDIMRGYYQTLSYKISDKETLKKLPGWEAVNNDPSSTSKSQIFYVIMDEPENPNSSQPPTPWQPVAISRDRPTNLDSDQVAIQAEYINQWQIIYGLETYYMPEDQRQKINEQIREAQWERGTFVVEIKVDSSGNAVPVSLWVRDINYKF